MWVKSYNNVWVWTNLHQAMLYSMQFHLPNIHDKAGLQSIATVEILYWAFHRLSLFLYKTKEARFKIVPVTEACLAIDNNSGANSKPLKSEDFLIACNWTPKIRFRWLSRFLSTPEVMESQLTDTRRPHCLVTDVADRQKLLNCIVVLSALWMQKIAVTTNGETTIS